MGTDGGPRDGSVEQFCAQTLCADQVGGSNGNLDFIDFMDGRSYKLQCTSACRTQQAET